MKSLTVLALALMLSACGTTPRQKAMIVGSVLLSGALAASRHDSNSDRHIPTPGVNCSNGACQ